MQKQEKNTAGHRARLRARFLQNGLDGFLDYEVVELLLTFGTPRVDCKPIAKSAIEKFGSLKRLLDASERDLITIKGMGSSNIIGIKLFKSLLVRYKKESVDDSILLTSPNKIAEYLICKFGAMKKEYFYAIFLDAQNKLIDILNVSIGTLTETLVHPREVFEPAMKSLAASIVIAHNHPSGDLTPSKEDLIITQRLASVGDLTGIPILDHIIVTDSAWVSLKEKGLI
jgi:DNA repair protein RadC